MNPALVLLTGASELDKKFAADMLPGVLKAYMVGIKAAFAVAVAFSGAACLCSLAVPMGKIATHAPSDDTMGED